VTLLSGESALLTFTDPLPGRAGTVRSYLLRSNGWYRIHAPIASTVDAALLGPVENEPGGLSRIATWMLNQTILAGHGSNR
jgi:hypothetical protein